MNDNEMGVLVAVGPDGVGDGALDHAAAEAVRLGTGVELVHVVHSLVAAPAETDQIQSVDAALTEVGQHVLTDAADRLRPRLAGRQSLSTEITFGPLVRTIAERGSRRRLVIVERRNTGRLERLLTASISSGVAAHSRVPVVVVPPDWSAAGSEALPVTVGVDHPLEAETEVAPAIEYARLAGRSCVVLHAAWLAEPYQDVLFSDYPRERWLADVSAELKTGLKAFLQAHPEAALPLEVRWARPVDALVEATSRSSLLVLHRRPARPVVGARLGSVTRSVLQHAECPVLVVDRAGPTVTSS